MHSCRPAPRIYCGVLGFGTSTYTIAASFGSSVALTAGETVSAESAVGGSQLYSLVFPASASVAQVTLSVVAEVGRTTLYAGPYGPPPGFSSH